MHYQISHQLPDGTCIGRISIFRYQVKYSSNITCQIWYPLSCNIHKMCYAKVQIKYPGDAHLIILWLEILHIDVGYRLQIYKSCIVMVQLPALDNCRYIVSWIIVNLCLKQIQSVLGLSTLYDETKGTVTYTSAPIRMRQPIIWNMYTASLT